MLAKIANLFFLYFCLLLLYKTMTDTTQFNVGGTTYAVSRSLLESHANSMLAATASEKWQQDPEAEIFIERNGHRFQYVLDYMRDGKVVLPVTETKEAVLAELEYYGIESDAGCIIDTQARGATCFKSFGDCIYAMELGYICHEYAYMIVKTYMQKVLDGKAKTTGMNETTLFLPKHPNAIKSFPKNEIMMEVDILLSYAGLSCVVEGENYLSPRVSFTCPTAMEANALTCLTIEH